MGLSFKLPYRLGWKHGESGRMVPKDARRSHGDAGWTVAEFDTEGEMEHREPGNVVERFKVACRWPKEAWIRSHERRHQDAKSLFWWYGPNSGLWPGERLVWDPSEGFFGRPRGWVHPDSMKARAA